MREYPKGCRYQLYIDGRYHSGGKVTVAVTLDRLLPWVPHGERALLAIQPRGKMRWYLFDKQYGSYVNLVGTGKDVDVLLMHALLTS